jgi:hypothetical protein
MAVTLDYCETGEGFHTADSSGCNQTYTWFRHSFGPSITDQGLSNLWCTGPITTWEVSSATTSFDLTDFQFGNEVAWGVIKVLVTDGDSHTYSWGYKDKDGNALIATTVSFQISPSYYFLMTSGIGINYPGAVGSSTKEIYYNGDYSLFISSPVTGSKTFTVSNLYTTNVTTIDAADRGYIWIYTHYLVFINGNGNVMLINEDTGYSGSTVDSSNAGHIWFSSTNGDYHLYYVDHDGKIRRTKAGSKYRLVRNSSSDVALGSTTTANKGYIWVDTFDYAFIYAIAQDGNIIRIGPGYVGASDTQ